MQTEMIVMIIILIIGAGILSARLWCYRKQVRHIRDELAMLEEEDTNYQLTSYCDVGNTGEMITAFNRLIMQYKDKMNALQSENRIYRESITSISHDIRTPLTSVKGYVQMLQSTVIGEEKRAEYTRIIDRRLDGVTDMLNQLFEYARIEAGEMQLEAEVFQAGPLFAETISLFYDDFIKRGMEPKVTITKTPCRIRADRQAFVRIIENLIKNVFVHGTGGCELSLTEEEGQMILRVSNLTNTIEEGDIDRIFDRFYTTDLSRSRKTTGLGLAIVKRFTVQMNGSVKASLEGKRFTIQIGFPLFQEN